jgi:hypothetical protein
LATSFTIKFGIINFAFANFSARGFIANSGSINYTFTRVSTGDSMTTSASSTMLSATFRHEVPNGIFDFAFAHILE